MQAEAAYSFVFITEYFLLIEVLLRGSLMEPLKFISYQLVAVGIIWAGMLFFFKDMTDVNKMIFYITSSWFLLLLVLLGKELLKKRRLNKTSGE